METKRIGLIADLHSHAPGASDLPDAVMEAFKGVDLIVPVGDIGEAGALDKLATLATVEGTRGQDDPRNDDRLEPRRVLEIGGLAVGVIFQLCTPERGISIENGLELPDAPVDDLLKGIFGRPVDAVVYGATHAHAVSEHGGVLFVNPGSPTYADSKSVVVLEIRDGKASAEVVEIP